MSEEFGKSGGRSKFGSSAQKKRRPKRRSNFRKKRPPATLEFKYTDISSLSQYLTEEGKIVAARVSGLRAYQQRQLTTAIKRARHIGFLSPIRRNFIY